MKQVTVHIADKKYTHFVELMKSLDYVKKVETEKEPSKQQILQELKEAIKELALIEKGKLKARPVKDLLNEL